MKRIDEEPVFPFHSATNHSLCSGWIGHVRWNFAISRVIASEPGGAFAIYDAVS